MHPFFNLFGHYFNPDPTKLKAYQDNIVHDKPVVRLVFKMGSLTLNRKLYRVNDGREMFQYIINSTPSLFRETLPAGASLILYDGIEKDATPMLKTYCDEIPAGIDEIFERWQRIQQ